MSPPTSTFPFSPNAPHISLPAAHIHPPIPLIPISSPAQPTSTCPLPLSLSAYHTSQRWMAAGAYWSVRNGRSAQDDSLVDGEEMGDYFEGCVVEGEGGVYDEEGFYSDSGDEEDEGFYSDSEGVYDDEGFLTDSGEEEDEGFYSASEGVYDDEGFYSSASARVPISTLLSILHSPARAFSGAEEDFLADLPGLRAYVEADMQAAPLEELDISPPPASAFMGVEMAALEAWFAGGGQTPPLEELDISPPPSSTLMGVEMTALEAWFAGGGQTPPVLESPMPTLRELLDTGKAMFGMQAPRASPAARRLGFPSPPASATLRELLAMGRAVFGEGRVDSPMRVVPSPPGWFRCKAARREFDAGLASLPPPPPRFIARARGSE